MASCRHADGAAESLGSSSLGMRSLPLLLQRATSGRHQIGSSSYFHANAFGRPSLRLPPSSSPPREPHLECRSHPHVLGPKAVPGRHSTVDVQGSRGTDVCETILKRARVVSEATHGLPTLSRLDAMAENDKFTSTRAVLVSKLRTSPRELRAWR